MHRPEGKSRHGKSDQLIKSVEHAPYAHGHLLTGVSIRKSDFAVKIIPVFQIRIMHRTDMPEHCLLNIFLGAVHIPGLDIAVQELPEKLQYKQDPQEQQRADNRFRRASLARHQQENPVRKPLKLP